MTYVDWMRLADLVGKLFPVIIAGLVLMVTVVQNRWNNAVARRAAKVEDQKLRLSLLERRIALLDRFDAAIGTWFENGQITPEVVRSVQRVIVEADLIFPEATARLTAFRTMLWHYHSLERQFDILTDDEADLRMDVSAEATVLVGEMEPELSALRKQLIEIARVENVAPLPEAIFRLWKKPVQLNS